MPGRIDGYVPRDRGGFALMMVLFVLIVMTALVASTVALASNHLIVNSYQGRYDRLAAVADAGLEQARAKLNGNKSLYPDSGYTTLESNATVSDGAVIPGVKRWVYVGPTGITSGQYGIYGAVVAVARDNGGGVAIRKLMVTQESFSKFAYFTDIEPSNIVFGGGDKIFGPVHSNDVLKIHSTGASFYDDTRTAKTVQDPQYGTFAKGYVQNVPAIPMPTTPDLTKLKAQGLAGQTSITSNTNGAVGQASTRIEFIAIDLNADGDKTDENEGFFRVYKSTDYAWLSGDLPASGSPSPWRVALNCGHYHSGNVFSNANAHGTSGSESWSTILSSATRRCMLGGSDSLNAAGFTASDGKGTWQTWPGTVSSLLSARPDKNYLFPISRSLNPTFKGVIYVEGKVVVSGKLRGRVTLAATSDIIIGDDITYATDPSEGSCADILGLFSGHDVMIADNTLNSPGQALLNASTPSSTWYTFDDTSDEFIHGVVLALNNFTVEGYDTGATAAQNCGSTVWGRGCLYLTGGIIQTTRGAVGLSSGTGYLKRYSYDSCAATEPPPYFPTTGHFIKGQHNAVDPTGFNVTSYYADFQTP